MSGRRGDMAQLRVWLDDIVPAPRREGYTWFRNAEALVAKVEAGEVDFIHFDHDMGDGRITGYDLACRIETAALTGVQPPDWAIHSGNYIGAKRINEAMLSAHRLYREWILTKPPRIERKP